MRVGGDGAYEIKKCHAAIAEREAEAVISVRRSRPGKPTDNASIETLNGSFRDDCLNAHRAASLPDAQWLIEAWRRDYNVGRPRMGLGDLTLLEYRARPETDAGSGPPTPGASTCHRGQFARMTRSSSIKVGWGIPLSPAIRNTAPVSASYSEVRPELISRCRDVVASGGNLPTKSIIR